MTNYRGMSLMSIAAKVYNKILFQGVSSFFLTLAFFLSFSPEGSGWSSRWLYNTQSGQQYVVLPFACWVGQPHPLCRNHSSWHLVSSTFLWLVDLKIVYFFLASSRFKLELGCLLGHPAWKSLRFMLSKNFFCYLWTVVANASYLSVISTVSSNTVRAWKRFESSNWNSSFPTY